MSDSIREQIIDQIKTRLAIVQTDYGFGTDCGKNVFRAAVRIDPTQLDAITFFARRETGQGEYDAVKSIMPVDVQALLAVHDIESETQTERAERISQLLETALADIIEAMMGDRFAIAFTSGSREPVAGETFTGATSAATGYVESVTLSTGSWAAGNAAGTIYFRRKSGVFAAENIDIGAELNVATVAATVTRTPSIELVTNNLADGVYYESGGMDEYPVAEEKTIAVMATFHVSYPIIAGNPFSQP